MGVARAINASHVEMICVQYKGESFGFTVPAPSINIHEMDDKTASILSQLLRESITPAKDDLRQGIELLCSEHGLDEILQFHLMSEYGTKHLSKIRSKDLPDIWAHVRSMVQSEEQSTEAKILKFPGD